MSQWVIHCYLAHKMTNKYRQRSLDFLSVLVLTSSGVRVEMLKGMT
jgi:hypothetical protein